MELIKDLFSSSGFMPHGFCYTWDPFVIWLNAISDTIIALAYYTILSAAPLLAIILAIAGLVFGKDAVQGQLQEQLQGLIGEEGGKALQAMIAHASG